MISDTTSLTIGPLRVTIAAPDPAVHFALRSAYRAFAVGDSPAPDSLIVHVDFTSGPAPASGRSLSSAACCASRPRIAPARLT